MTTTSEARVATDLPRRYLGQLCKHFEHKLPVTYTDLHGEIEFSSGRCVADAEAGHLVLRAEAKDEASLPGLQDVIARHLIRFAFREPLTVAWQKVTA